MRTHVWLVTPLHQDTRHVSRNYSKLSVNSQKMWLTAVQRDRGANKQPTGTWGLLQMMGRLHHCQELISKRRSLLSSIYRYTLFREENYINGALAHLGEREFEGWEHTDTTRTMLCNMTQATSIRYIWRDLPLQLLSSQGKTQFWMPLHTSDVLIHMLLWQKNALPAQGAGKQGQAHYHR